MTTQIRRGTKLPSGGTMGVEMAMNIKSTEAARLAHELADLTGESLTAAVTVALRERLERVQRDRLREGMSERLLAIGRENVKHLREPYLSMDHGDLLYDERGLPK